MEVMTMGVRVVEDNRGGIKILLGNTEVRGYKDEHGVYYLTKCLKCGAPVRQYINRKGPKRLYCDSCKASSGVKVENGALVTKRGRLEIVEE
jgi:hypothetical protein